MASTNLSILIYSVVVFLAISIRFTSAQNESEWEVNFDKHYMHMVFNEPKNFTVILKHLNISHSNQSDTTIGLVSGYPKMMLEYQVIPLSQIDDIWNRFSVKIRPLSIGNANISVAITTNNKTEISNNHVAVSVTRNYIIKQYKQRNILFYIKLMQYFYMVINVCFGIVLDVKKIRTILKNPIGLGLAIISDFIILPLVSIQS